MTTQAGATLDAGLLRALDQGGATVGVAMVVRVQSYDPAQQTATVLPMVQGRRVVGGVTEPVKANVLYDCPVVFPSAGGRSITWGLVAGDLCLCIVRDRSHDEIDSGSSGPLLPAASRRHNASDAVVYPGYAVPGSMPDSAVRSDGQVVVRMPGDEAMHVGVALASRALALAEETADALNILRDALDGHEHQYVAPSSGGSTAFTTLGPDVDPLPDIASTRILVDQ